MDQERTILFVCEHGSAKSVVAAALLDRLARERHIDVRAVSRGTDPYGAVASNAVLGLEADGLRTDATPERLSSADVEASFRVVAFCPLPEEYGGSRAIEVWDDVPPVSEDCDRARVAIGGRIGRLLDELAEPARGAARGPES